ncbi:DUF340 domain-containing protein [Anaerophilus nitritogenes]|uniref:DUF340 domain-containing protein n=1 Tax=Anaerophilus nitritogenes TaxID=2498136 RepID=UPI00101BA3BC|nr:DUF340 domain-containing protein [Anaerophilus nitritogenes]
MNFKNTLFVLIIISILSLVSNFIGYHTSIIESIPGMIILVIICLAGVALSKIIPLKIPSVAYIVLIGCMVTFPYFSFASTISTMVEKVNFLSLTTAILAYTGISIGKDLDAFAKSSWKIIFLSCFIFIGTYISSAIISQIILKLTNQI